MSTINERLDQVQNELKDIREKLQWLHDRLESSRDIHGTVNSHVSFGFGLGGLAQRWDGVIRAESGDESGRFRAESDLSHCEKLENGNAGKEQL